MSDGDLTLPRGVPALVDPATLTALEAVEHIRRWTQALEKVSTLAEVQRMGAAWAIQREYPEREAFAAFAGPRLAGMYTSEQLWLMAENWGMSRSSPRLRELTRAHPGEALEVTRTLVEAGAQERLARLDQSDRALLEVLDGPPREMSARLRKLLDRRHPEDVKRIETLTEERDAARAALADADQVHGLPTATINEVITDLQRLEREAAADAERFEQHDASTAQRERALRAIDLIIGHMERMSVVCMEDV